MLSAAEGPGGPVYLNADLQSLPQPPGTPLAPRACELPQPSRIGPEKLEIGPRNGASTLPSDEMVSK